MELAPLTALKARALGPAGEAWLDALPELVAELERRWDLVVGAPFRDGSASYVANATSRDGTPVVLKLAMPDGLDGQGDWLRELRAVRLGQGHGYVTLLEFDVDRRAMLLEKLGRQLVDSGLSIEDQLDVIAATLMPSWQADDGAWHTGAEQAEALAVGVRTDWERCGRPCPEHVLVRAEEYALALRDEFDAASAVVIHGDAHSWNVLESAGGGFKLVDPDAMLSHPAHDLAIPIRHWNDELLADPDPVARVRDWCLRMAAAAGAPEEDVWRWAYVERISTGLFILRLGDPSGSRYLDVAARLVT